MSTSITQLQLNGELAVTGTARVIQVAAPPTESNKAPLSRQLLLGGVAGLVIGVGLALLVENLDRTIKTAEDATRAVHVPVLGEIPLAGKDFKGQEIGMAVSTQPEGAIADGYQKVRTALQFAMMGSDYHSLLITSANQSEGKTTTSSNLAWALAAIGNRVVLADVDFRRPRVHEVYKIAQEPGISNHFVEGQPMHEIVVHVDTVDSNLVVLPTGPLPPSPVDFLASSLFGNMIDFLQREADFLVLDAPPVLPVSDALAVAGKMDATVLVVRAGETTADELRHAVQSLEQAGAKVAGLVLVGVKARDRYGKHSYYGAPTNEPRRLGPIPTRRAGIDETKIAWESDEPRSEPVPNGAVIDVRSGDSTQPEPLGAENGHTELSNGTAKPKRATRR